MEQEEADLNRGAGHIAAGTMIRGAGAAPVLFFGEIWCNMVAGAITGGISL